MKVRRLEDSKTQRLEDSKTRRLEEKTSARTSAHRPVLAYQTSLRAKFAMDFRGVDPGSVRPRVQTPTCNCTVQATGRGIFRINLRVTGSPVRREFATWVAGVDDAMKAKGRSETARFVASMRDGVMRLTAFSDTPAFDGDGKLSVDLPAAKSVACVVEPTGTWARDDVWGVRWRIVQLKFFASSLPEENDDAEHSYDFLEPSHGGLHYGFLD